MKSNPIPRLFIACTDTIVRQVDDIGRMVDEFSAFARMPSPVLMEHDIVQLCRQAVFMHNTGRSDIVFEQDLPAEPVIAVCDGRQIAQALTNILKNATEAVESRMASENAAQQTGHVILKLDADQDKARITVADNGRGLPIEDRHRLTEPYVTTRSKGTGLGLAIVKKIMEDHHGSLELDDRAGGGAVVTLTLQRQSQIQAA
ncbi:MAG: ATP-binding protein [Alphaproteobacteria bacterium]